MRYERADIAGRLRTAPLPDYLTLGDTVPVVYHVDFRSAEGMLLAQNFQMRDLDIVYVATSPSVQIGKLAVLLNSVTSIFKCNSYNAFRRSSRLDMVRDLGEGGEIIGVAAGAVDQAGKTQPGRAIGAFVMRGKR